MGRLVDYTNTRPAPALVGNEEMWLRSAAGASIQTTPQDIANLATLDVNTTLFVDPVNGSASGVRGDMKRPFNTLANAGAAASSGDTFICRPGNCGALSVGTDTYSVYAMPGASCQVQASTNGTWNCYGPGAIQADLNHASGTLNLFNCANVSSMNITAAGSIDFYGSCNVSTMNFPAPVVPTVTNYGYLSVITQWIIGTSLTIDNRGCLVSIPAFHASLTIAGPGLAIDDTNNQARINSTLVVQQHGGTPGTDEVQISHNGSNGYVQTMSGTLHLTGVGGIAFNPQGSQKAFLDNTAFYVQGVNIDLANSGSKIIFAAATGGMEQDDAASPSDFLVQLGAATTATNDGAGFTLKAGDGNTSGDGGTIKLIAGEDGGSGSDGTVQIWHGAEGANDYVFIKHTGGDGNIGSASGLLTLDAPDGVNLYDSGSVLISASSSQVEFARLIRPSAGGVRDVGQTARWWNNGYMEEFWLYRLGAAPSVPSTDFAGLYSLDVAGTKELFGIDGGGTSSQLTSHPADAPPVMYDEVAGVEEFSRSSNYYRGEIRWINRERMAKLSGMTDAEKSALSADERVVFMKESFGEYNTRMGLSEGDDGFQKIHDWDEDQLKQQAEYDEQIAGHQVDHDKWQQRKDAAVAKRTEIVAFKPTVTKNAILTDLDAKIEAEEDEDEKVKLQEQRDKVAARNFIAEKAERVAKVDQEIANLDAEEPEVLPVKNIKKPKPQWLS